jgi:DNA-binding HxlR family transcriptional regulator
MDSEIIKKYGDPDHCPVRNVVDRIGDKWSVLILILLDEVGVMRFNEIHGSIQTISQKMLTVTLKSLQADGLLIRTVYPQIPPKVEYKLTPRGKSLIPHLHNLIFWAQSNMDEIIESRKTVGIATFDNILSR